MLVDRAVVHQFEVDAIFQAFGDGAIARLGQLLAGQRDAGDPGAVVARQCQRQAAPAAADIEHREIRPIETQLGGDMAFLRQLRLFQRFVAAREIGAGILPVAIEEQAVETAVQIVMMRDIFLRPHGWVVLIEPSFQLPQERCGTAGSAAVRCCVPMLARHDVEYIVDAATVGRDAAVHIAPRPRRGRD